MATKDKRPSVLSGMTERIAKEFAAGTPPIQPSVANKPTPAPSQLIHFSADYQQAVDELDELKRKSGQSLKLKLTQLVDSPYQIAPLEEERISALVDNLRSNPLSTPVVVRRTADADKFELLAGHHRKEAFNRLQRESIDAVIVEVSDDEAARLVFYDNLLAPSLSDFDKYVGFSRRLKSSGLTQRDIAAEAGVSQATLSSLMAFERLPETVAAYIRDNKRDFSARVFRELAAASESCSDELLLAGAVKVQEGVLPVKDLGDWLKKSNAKGSAVASQVSSGTETVVLNRGAKPFVVVKTKGLQLSLKFKTPSEFQAWSSKVMEMLKSAE